MISKFSTLSIEFAISGVSDIFEASKEVNIAETQAELLRQNAEKIKIKTTSIRAVFEYANIHFDLLNNFIPMLDEYVPRAVDIIKSKDNFLHFGYISEEKFTEEEIKVLAFTMSLVGAVNIIINSPIISKTGEVFDGDKSKFYSNCSEPPVIF